MAHFARLDENDIVIQVVKLDDVHVMDLINAVEDAARGAAILEQMTGESSDRWRQTSYNDNIRKNFACVGMIYDREADAFYWPSAPESYSGWVLNIETYRYDPPTPQPSDEHVWDNENQGWVLLE